MPYTESVSANPAGTTLADLDGGAHMDFDMAKREVTVSSDVEAGILISSINAGGYEAQVI